MAVVNEQDALATAEADGDGVLSVSYASTPTAGNILVAVGVARDFNTTATVPAYSDASLSSGANDWTLVAQATTGAGGHRGGMWWRVAGASEATTVTFDCGLGTVDIGVQVFEFSHDFTTPVLSAAVSSFESTSSSTTVQPGSTGAAESAPVLWVGFGSVRAGPFSTLDIDGSVVEEGEWNAHSRWVCEFGWLDAAATTAQNWTWTCSSSASRWAMLAGIVEGAAGTPTATPDDLAHGHVLDAAAVSAATDAVPADLAHASTLDAAAVAAAADVVPVDLAHAGELGTVVVTARADAAPIDLEHAHALAVATVAAAADPAPVDLAHAGTLDTVTVTSGSTASPVDLEHASTLDPVTVSAAADPAPADLAHGHTLDTVTVTPAGTAAPADIVHVHVLASITVAAAADPTPDDLTHGHTLDTVTVTAGITATAADLAHGHDLDVVVMSARAAAAPARLDHSHVLDAVLVVVGGLVQVLARLITGRDHPTITGRDHPTITARD